MGEAGLHQLQVPTVAGRALLVAPCRCGQALGAETPHGGADPGVVEVGVQDDVEDVVEQRQAPHLGANRLGLALGDPISGCGVGAGQDHVEQAHRLVDDLAVGSGQRREQDGVAALGSHLAQRSGGGASCQGGELAQALGPDGAQVETMGAQALQVGQLGHRGLDPFGRGRGGAVVQPHQAGHAELGLGGHQGVELLAALRGQLWVEKPAYLVLGADSGGGNRPHEPVETGPHHPVGP